VTGPLQTSAKESGGRRAFTVACLALIFTLMLPAAGLALSVFGIIVSIRDIRALHQAKIAAGLAIAGLVVSGIAFMLATMTTAVQLYFAAEFNAYAECRKGAGTVTAEHDCADQLKRAIENRLGIPWPANMPFPT
jgi:mannose/fructose/N-acetylgalactosamine-specific phosphotransferase system component IID